MTGWLIAAVTDETARVSLPYSLSGIETGSQWIMSMYHVIEVGMNGNALRQLDDLRRAYPNLYNRKDILLKLVAEAHAKLEKIATVPKLQLVA